MGSPKYYALPRESSESDRLVIGSDTSTFSNNPGKSYNLPLNYILVLRLISLALAPAAFAGFVIQRYWTNDKYVSADVFLMFIIVFNLIRVLHSFITSVFHVDIEISRGSWHSNLSVRPNGPNATHIVDALLATGLLASMIGGLVDNWQNYRVVPSIVLSFFVIAIQYIIALPIKNPTFLIRFKFHKEDGERSLDHETPRAVQPVYSDDEHRQTPEDIV